MRLKRLELQGFKSFLDKTILDFDSSITGVVGPNGCGKSNIVDAILWVMGEQSPKHLRGESMVDVIFNGSANRSPSAMAEVSLILDRSNVSLAAAFSAFDKGDEISITRRVFRDGSSEYLINRVPCRLKDIHELFMDTGVGRRAYSIIEQGQIDRMINVKPEERRGLFEEVAGITKYKIKRKEAERKLEQTQVNLQRVNDIIVELDKQIRSLKIQASKAKKYKEIKGELETLDLYLMGKELYDKKEEERTLTLQKQEWSDQKVKCEAELSTFESNLTSIDLQVLDDEKNYETLSQRERELELQLQKAESDLKLFEERRGFIEQNQTTLRSELSSMELQHEKWLDEAEHLRLDLEQVAIQTQSTQEKLNSLDRDWKLHLENKKQLDGQKNSLEHSINKSRQKKIELTAQNENLSQRIEENQFEIEQWLEKKVKCEETLTEYDQKVQFSEGKLTAISSTIEGQESKAAEVSSRLRLSSQKLSELEEELFEKRSTYQQKKSRLESLQELSSNLEGYSSSAREIIQNLKEEGIEIRPLGELLRPAPHVEDKLEYYLSQDLNCLVVATAHEAQKVIDRVAKSETEQVKIIVLDLIDGEVKSTASSLASLSGLIQFESGFERLKKIFEGVYVVETNQGLEEARLNYPGHNYLSLEGFLISLKDSSYITGKPKTRTGVFERKREIELLVGVEQQLREELERLEQAKNDLLADITSMEQEEELVKNTLSGLHIEKVEWKKELERQQMDKQRLQKDVSEIASKIQGQEDQLQRFEASLLANQSELEEISIAQLNAESDLKDLEQKYLEITQQLEECQRQVQGCRIETSTLMERKTILSHQREKVQVEIELSVKRKNQLLNQLEQEQKELEKLSEQEKHLTDLSQQRSEQLRQQKVALSEAKSKLDDLRHEREHQNYERELRQKKRNEVAEELQLLEIKLLQVQSSLEQLISIANERYQIQLAPVEGAREPSLESLPLFQESLSVSWEVLVPQEKLSLLKEHVIQLRQKIDRYGEVNLTAIQEFEEIQKRHEFLSAQKDDLDKSVKILEEAIQKIDETSHLKFKDTFEAVNAKFKEIFPVLFNGGKAELTLTMPDSILESGVDVMVQPPGKRLQSISLLSGGEKALTAVSLVLSIFARKPSPFCLLDEVDAPLDDANVSRFNTVIKKMAEKTQFIVITHNKKTMEIADALYGVTMEKMGVSKMTSVRLH